MYDLLIICSGQGTCSVWTNTYRDNWQNEERVQGERIEKHILISELFVQCWAMGYKYIIYFFISNLILFHNEICNHTFSLSIMIIEWVFPLVTESVMDRV